MKAAAAIRTNNFFIYIEIDYPLGYSFSSSKYTTLFAKMQIKNKIAFQAH